jgi:hypothetical protein
MNKALLLPMQAPASAATKHNSAILQGTSPDAKLTAVHDKTAGQCAMQPLSRRLALRAGMITHDPFPELAIALSALHARSAEPTEPTPVRSRYHEAFRELTNANAY